MLLFFIFCCKSFGQQETIIDAFLNETDKVLVVNQQITFTNYTNKSLSKIILNDWNNAYSSKYSPLAKRFSDEYVRSFHLATNYERGETRIDKITSDNNIINWKRADNHLDLIEIQFAQNLEANKTITLNLGYTLKIPDSKFTRYGYDNDKFNLNNCFINIARFSADEQVLYSNENLDDLASVYFQKSKINITIPIDFDVTSNFEEKNVTKNNITKTISLETTKKYEIQLFIEKKNSYQSFKNEQIEVVTNLNQSKVNEFQKSVIIDKIIKYADLHLGNLEQSKIVVSQSDYDKNPFYGLNQLPSFISPFPNEFLFELKFLKAYLNQYLKTSLNIDYRKNGFIFDGIQVYTMLQYINENYPDLKMQGNIAKYKILKGYNIINAPFNEQYSYLYLLMARDNLDQDISQSKNSFIKFNEQIAGKYKAGLSFKYLDNVLKNNQVENNFKEFLALNKKQPTELPDFENIFTKNSKNIDWFFNDLIHSRKIIDYKFGKVIKQENETIITIKNNSNSTVPIELTGFKDKQVVFSQWLQNVKTDTTFTIKKEIADKLVLNYNNYIPEYNRRNNFKSLKGFFSLNRPIQFNFFKDLENASRNQIFFVPEVGYNLYDGIIASLSLHNKSFLNRTFIYDVSPSFALGSKQITGSASFFFRQQIRDKKLFEIRYGLSGSNFNYIQNASYLRLSPVLQFKFRDDNLRSNKRQFLTFRNVFVNKEAIPVNAIISPSIRDSPLNYSVFNAKYNYQNSEFIKGLAYGTDLQFASDFGKLTTEFSYRKLLENNYEFSLRFYAGTFLYRKTNSEFYSFGLDRPKDYMFDYSYFGRSETSGFFSQEFIMAEGGFKSKFQNPYANKWMTTINATSSIYHWIEMYGDVGLYKNIGQKTKFVFDSGIHLDLVPGYFELFLPVVSTNGFEMGQKNYQEKIRFIITLNPKTLLGLFTRKWF